MAMTLVSTVTVGAGGASQIEWTGIPQSGKDLLVLFSGRLSDNSLTVTCRINGQNTSFNSLYQSGDGSSVFVGTDSNAWLGFASVNSNTSNTFGSMQVYLSNYTSSANKSFSVDWVTENNATSAWQGVTAGSRSNTSAITSFSVNTASGTFVQHSTASLYIIS